MTVQNYLQIQNNIVSNIIVWDGNLDTWTPPSDATMLIQADIYAWIWISVIDVETKKITDWVLDKELGCGGVGFTYDLTTQTLTTNEPKPSIPTI